MTDIISKVIALLLAAALLLFAPLTISSMISDMSSRRIALNEVEQFIDKVTDKGSISYYDLDDLALGLAASGIAFDYEVYRYLGLKYNTNGTVETAFILSDDDFSRLSSGNTISLSVGDMIQVEVNALEYTKQQTLMRDIFKLYSGQYTFTLAGTVR